MDRLPPSRRCPARFSRAGEPGLRATFCSPPVTTWRSADEHRVRQGDGDLVHGAFTYFLPGAGEGGGRGDVPRCLRARRGPSHRPASAAAPADGGAVDHEVFGRKDLESLSTIPVLRRQESLVWLGGGAAHGLVAGFRVDHPPGRRLARRGGGYEGRARAAPRHLGARSLFRGGDRAGAKRRRAPSPRARERPRRRARPGASD